jgi:DNA polymerase-3 subunit beta
MLNNLKSENIRIELSSPNRAGLISPVNSTNEKEEIVMLVMPIMLN